jgi:hypothetical protein
MNWKEIELTFQLPSNTLKNSFSTAKESGKTSRDFDEILDTLENHRKNNPSE